MKKWLACSLLLLGACLVCLGTGMARAEQGADLLKMVLEKNEAAKARIKTVSYTIETEFQGKSGRWAGRTLHGSGQVRKKGDWHWSTYRSMAFNRTEMRETEVERRVVVNEHYFAYWPMKGNPLAYQDDITSVGALDRKMQARLRGMKAPEDFLQHCFGTDGGPFRQDIAKYPPEKIRWDVVEVRDAQGKAVYHLRRFMMQDENKGARPDLVYVIDPAKGWLATEDYFYFSDGQVYRHGTRRVEEVAPGAWFPVAYEETDFDRLDEIKPPTLRSVSKGTLKEIKVNEPMAASQFEIDALNLRQDSPPELEPMGGLRVLRTGLDGKKTTYVYEDGKLVPEKRPWERKKR